MAAKPLEFQHTIRLIRKLNAEITEIKAEIEMIIAQIPSPITTIPSVSFRITTMILAGVGDFTRFESLDKLLAYAGIPASTY